MSTVARYFFQLCCNISSFFVGCWMQLASQSSVTSAAGGNSSKLTDVLLCELLVCLPKVRLLFLYTSHMFSVFCIVLFNKLI